VVSEETKACNLLKKITDPTVDAAKQAICINEQYKSYFSAATHFLSACIVPLAKGRDHNISSFSRNTPCGGSCTGGTKMVVGAEVVVKLVAINAVAEKVTLIEMVAGAEDMVLGTLTVTHHMSLLMNGLR
jgi:hypothetical protein